MTSMSISSAAAPSAITSAGPAAPGPADSSGAHDDITRSLVLPAELAPVALLGVRDEVLRAIERGFPDVDLYVRGSTVTVTGEESRVDVVVLLLSELIDVARAGTPLTPDAVERAIGLLAASARPAEVLADDVLTSGATLAGCARALEKAGARVVGAVVLAAAADPRSRRANVI